MKKGAFNQENLCFFSPSTQKKNEFNGQKKNPYAYTPNKFARILDLKTFFSRSHPPKIDFNSRFKKRCYFPLFAAM
jgi:hypothetical protein